MPLTLTPVTLRQAAAFIALHHRHHPPPRGWKFGVGASRDGRLVAVAVVGRPVARLLDDGLTLEVTRLCTVGGDDAKNAASLLYSAAWRAARAIGYRRMLTYTLETESGHSLLAAGWTRGWTTRGESWARKSRPRTDHAPTGPKVCWLAPGSERPSKQEVVQAAPRGGA